MEYTSYERVKAALEHREPDRIPFDLGGSVLTGINRHTYKRLREYLGLTEKTVEVYDVMQQLGLLITDDERVITKDGEVISSHEDMIEMGKKDNNKFQILPPPQ